MIQDLDKTGIVNGKAKEGGKTKHALYSVLVYKGVKITEEIRTEITCVRICPQVKDIPSGTFQGCINLVEVQFCEGSLQAIGEGAFRDCTALQQVTIPPSVTKLGSSAFQDCSNLTEVNFNNRLEVIEEGTFRNCTALKSVTIPASVTKVRSSVFWAAATWQ
ncbi:hypothetical protein THAOC_20240, partial [Thalassiosira oceanica]